MLTDYTGYLLAAHPLRQEANLRQGVIFVVDHCVQHGTFGLQINKPLTNGINFIGIMNQLGFPTDNIDQDIPVYYGGTQNQTRIYVLHSDDWSNSNTIQYGSKINLTNDLSVLSAISKNQGPKSFRAIAGNCLWAQNELESQINNLNDTQGYESWSYTVSNKSLVFEKEGRDQWNSTLLNAGKLQVNKWFA